MSTPDVFDGEPQRVARGARLAIDVGMVRVGVAASDPDGILASPVETLPRDRSVTYSVGGKIPATLPKDVAAIRDIAEERFVHAIYVGMPKHLSGAEGASAQMAVTYADLLARVIPGVEVFLIDERLSSVTAHQVLHASGKKMKNHRAVVDQAAAVVILESALEVEKRSGARAGRPLRDVV